MKCRKCATVLTERHLKPKHRVMVGDATCEADMAALCAGETINAVITDPPYGVGAEYGEQVDTKESLAELVNGFLPIARRLAPVVALTPGNGNQSFYPYPDWVFGWFFASGMNRIAYGFQNWQPILVWGKDPYLAAGRGARPDAFWISEAMEEIDHPCPKPTKTWEWIIERFTVAEKECVYDPFLGSGTTIVACEQLDRRGFGMEIEPKYVAVTLERLSQMGLTPELTAVR